MRSIAFLFLLCAILIPTVGVQAAAQAPARDTTVILADPDDAYYPLAEEIARQETLPVVHSLAEVLERDPVFLLWVVSPSSLSDEVLVDFGLVMRDQPSAISVGIISGITLENARELWLRAAEVQGKRVVAVNAANPAGRIEARINVIGESEAVSQPLTKANLLHNLGHADYLTFTGHGGKSYLQLDENTTLRPADLPSLPPIVVATGSCNTFRPWEQDPIPLAFARQGAAAYAGFAYSPNEGYLIGEFHGLPFRYTWPDLPIGHVVQVQNHGTLQGFAQFPYYYLLGDPRIALQAEVPYQLVEDRVSGDTRTLTYAGAPSGMVPVRIPGGAAYRFVQVPGVSAAGEYDPFYNARLEMVDIQDDKYVLFAHQGGDFVLRLRARPPWHWVAGDLLTDALDDTLLFLPQTGGDILSLGAVAIALLLMAWVLLRKKVPARSLVPAALAGFGFAALHGLYALARLDKLTITSKSVEFSLLSLVSTFLLVACGAFLFFNARSWCSRAVAVIVATSGALAPAVFTLGVLSILNNFFFRPRMGAGLYNYSLGLQPLVAFVFLAFLLGLVFSGLSRAVKRLQPAARERGTLGREADKRHGKTIAA